MRWQIETPAPVDAAHVVESLSESRDAWVRETPQESDTLITQLDDAVSNTHNEARAQAAKLRRDHIALANARGLDKVHQECIRQMNSGAKAAASVVADMPAGTFVRVTLVGQYEPDHEAFRDEVVVVHINMARPPS